MDRSSANFDLEQNRAASRDAVFFYWLAGLLVFAPLFWGGNHPFPLLISELLALGLLVGQAWRPSRIACAHSWQTLAFLAFLLLLPLVQLLPVPLELWASLPGRAFYAEALQQADASGPGFEWRAISLIPAATESTWLALLPPLAVFVVAFGLPERFVSRLVLLFLGIAVGQALLGLIQYGDGPDSPFRFGNDLMGTSAVGTYINRNHLAGLLEMALPVALGLLAVAVGQSPRRVVGRRRRGWRRWLAHLDAVRFNRALLYGAAALAILLGLIFTRSRSGVLMAMLGILACTLLFSNRLGGRNVYGLLGTFTAAGIGLAILIGLVPVLERFTEQDSLADGRWPIFDASVEAIRHFFPLGSGAGTFEAVLRRFHPADLPGVTINRAHNDYLEWLLEAGLGAALLIVVWLALYLRQWRRVWIRGEWTPFRCAQVGAGIALLLLMLHSLTDFNLRIPANAMFAALLAAVFFHRAAIEKRRPAHRRESPDDSDGSDKPLPPSPPPSIPPENQVNPFAS